jgi:outer membrane immunogenic protein
MRINPIFASAVLAGLVSTGAMAGDYSKAGPGVQEPVVSTPAPTPAPARFNWTGGYAGAGLGYGNMNFRGGDDASSATAGLFAGYRQDMGFAILGAEALLAPVAFGSPTLPSGDEIKGGGALLFTAGLPVSADARTLAYVGVGPSMLRTSGTAGSENSIGGMAAIGVDHMLTDSIMLRGSVNYTAINNVGQTDINTRTLGAGVGVGFKF